MIDFYLGDIHLGGSLGASIITPVDLVPGALDETNPVALNIARFLQSLDDDLTPDNGILIIPAIANAAIGKSLNFSSSDFDTEANALLAELTSGIYVPVRTLVDSTGAADHLGGSITTELSGIYVGNISGDDSGTWRLVLGIDGTFSGTILSAALNRLVVSGSVSSDGTILGTTSPVNLTLDAQVSLDGSLSGSYRPSAGMLANLVGAREVIDPDTGTDPGTGGTGTGSGGTGTGGTGSGGTDPGTGTGGTGSGGAGTGTGGSTIPLGSISLTGPDTSATGNLYEPTMGIKETGAISYNTLGGNTGYATSLLILNLSPDDELIMATYSWSNGDKNNPATVNYTYSLLCPTAGNGDCSTVSIDVANNNIRFSNAYLNNVFADGTAPMTLNGTLNFVPVN
jgi:hypothetical protein